MQSLGRPVQQFMCDLTMEASFAVDMWMQSVIPPAYDKTDEMPFVVLEEDE